MRKLKNMKTLPTLLVAVFALFSNQLFADEVKPALGGHCPVCYIAAGKAAKGSSEFQAEHKGKVYYFVSAETRDSFKKTPEKFLPAYDGYCGFGMSLGKKFESDPTVFTVVGDKYYLNKDADIGKKFSADSANLIKKADAQWKTMTMKMAEEKKMEKEKMMKK